MSAELRIARVTHRTIAEGPGIRTAVWTQGCTIRCAGCVNPQLFAAAGGVVADVPELVREAVRTGAEGITVIGGEPFDQPLAVAELSERARDSGLGVMVFSGYRYEDLQDRSAPDRQLLAAIDLLVDGPYIAAMPETTRGLVGSTNQRFIHLTDRYAGFSPGDHPNRIDVRIAADGSIEVAGFLDPVGISQLGEMTVSQRRKRPPGSAKVRTF